jgi:hypothetical protein
MIPIETKYNQLVDENAMLTRTIAALKTALHQAQIPKSTDNAGLREAINVEKKRGGQ